MFSQYQSTQPAQLAGETVATLLSRHLSKPVLLLLSGGSALALLEYISDDALSPNVTFGMLDDRFSLLAEVNNAAQIKALPFFLRAKSRGMTFLDSTVFAGETLADYAFRYNKALKTWRSDNPTGVVIVTLGLGLDGHTAGIMPGGELSFDNTGDYVVGYEVPPEVNQYTRRITVTPYFLCNEVTAAVAYVVDLEKKVVLDQVLDKSGDCHALPARLWHEIPELTIITNFRATTTGC